jgi:hypothetical protein
MRKIFLIIIALISFGAFAQISDDFSDGDITNNPTWIGNIDSFIVNTSNELQLNANIAGSSYISTNNSMIDDTEWRFKVDINLAEAPQSLNLIKEKLNGKKFSEKKLKEIIK